MVPSAVPELELGPRLRRAQQREADLIASIYLEAIEAAMPWLRLAHGPGEVRRWLREVLLVEDEVWVAAERERPLGFAALSRRRDFLDQLYVAPAHQGRGLGSELLALCQALSPGPLRLWAFQRNRAARGFYERRGFRVVLETDGSGNEEREPDVLYEWRRERA